MENVVEDIKRKVDIVDIIGSLMTLKKAGRNFKGLCPFHQEKTPSFVVSPDRQIWHCFGACQDGGDVIKFLMRYENISFFEALKELGDKVGVQVTSVGFEDKSWKTRERLFSITNLAGQYYNYLLTSHTVGANARDYLKNRNVSEKLIKTFGLGYSPSSWDSLHSFLKKKKFSDVELFAAGLVIKSDRGSYYDRFRGRIMFPIKDIRGNILGFSGRVLTGESTAKYVNTPETDIYHKRETFFGLHLSRDAIKREQKVIVVEGEFDMISLFREGIDNVVAVKGSVVTQDQLTILSRLSKEIVFALDVDFAGSETTKRAIIDAEELDLKLSVAVFDFGKDPDEAITKDPVQFKQLIKKPVPVYDFIIDAALSKHSSADVFSKKDIADDVAPFLTTIQNPIVKSHYINKLGDILNVDTDSIETLMRNIIKVKTLKFKKTITAKKRSLKPRSQLLEQCVLSAIFQSETPYEIYEKVARVIESSDFEIPSHQKLYDILEENKKNNSPFTASSFSANLPAQLREVFDELYLFDITMFEDAAQDALEKILFELKRISIKRQIKSLAPSAETEKDQKEIQTLTKMLSQVEKKLLLL